MRYSEDSGLNRKITRLIGVPQRPASADILNLRYKASVTLAPAIDAPPDWSQQTTPEFCCPLCEYNLRGLTEPRCPECGFAFTWAELIQGQREGHKFLFEHHPKRNVWSFWKTYWRDWLAARFWMDVNPAQAVRVRRLMMFWVLSMSPALILVLGPFVWNLWNTVQLSRAQLAMNAVMYTYWKMTPPAPPPFSSYLQSTWQATTDDIRHQLVITGSLQALLWPWLTILFLLVFSQSMRMAKIKKRHVLRAVVYGCDYYLLMIPVILLCQLDGKLCDSVIFLALACGGVSLYRLYFAYSRYLRFHLPFVTVLTSQILVFMIALIVYFQTYSPN